MNRIILCALIVTLGVQGSFAQGRSKPEAKLLIHGGLAIPVGPEEFSDGYTIGFGGGIGLGVRMAPPVMIAARVDYTLFNLDADGNNIPEGSVAGGGQTTLLYASADLRIEILQLPSNLVRPYFIGGMGYFRASRDDLVVDGETRKFETESTIGLHGGGGVDVTLAPFMDIFFEVVFIVGFTDGYGSAGSDGGNTVYVPFRLGLTLGIGAGGPQTRDPAAQWN